MRKKLMMVARISSGTWAARIFIMLGQNRPTQNSNMQKATNWICPWNEIPAERSQCCKQHSSHRLGGTLFVCCTDLRTPWGSQLQLPWGAMYHAVRHVLCLGMGKWGLDRHASSGCLHLGHWP